MKGKSLVKECLSAFKENELIIASKLYKEKLSGVVSEAAYYKTLQRMCEAKELLKIAKGTYCLPKIGKYGLIPPSEGEIIKAFTENETGTVIGYVLYNELNLTTQIAKNITVISSNLDSMTKSLRNVTVYYVSLRFSEEIVKMIQSLEVLQNFYEIQDLNYSAFFKFTEKIALNFNDKAFEKIMKKKPYKKSTIAFLQEILNYYNIKNNLSEYLSTLSEYKYPKMEELYETA